MPRTLAALLFLSPLALCALASAQPRIPGERLPAQKDDVLLATKVTKAASLPLLRTARVVRKPGKPHALASHPLAERELRGEGVRVVCAGLIVRRLGFDTSQEASVAATLLGQGARVDPKQDTCVTQLLGKATPKLLARVESRAAGATLPADLAATLGLEEQSRRTDTCSIRVPKPAAGFTGVEVVLEGLSVARLRFASADQAAAFLAERALEGGGARVLDQSGPLLVLLEGPALAKLPVAQLTLLACWKGVTPPRAKTLGTIGVWDAKGAFACFSVGPGALYQRSADLLRLCRKSDTGSVAATGLEWKFSDPGTRNHLRIRRKSTRPSAEVMGFGGVLATSGGNLHVSGPTQVSCDAQRRYLFEVLEALGQPLPPRAKEQVRLLPAK